MALGFSGSNGGINHRGSVHFQGVPKTKEEFRKVFPLEISYFVNSRCNLSCKHCYVGYRAPVKEILTSGEWRKVITDAIDAGALTFGNVGKEPLLAFDKTVGIAGFLQGKRCLNQRIRFGLVTNATLLDTKKQSILSSAGVDWIDVSFDGLEFAHDRIRGKGNFARSFANLASLPRELKQKVFIIFTATAWNMNELIPLISSLKKLGIRRFMVSLFVPTHNENSKMNSELTLREEHFCEHLGGILGDRRCEGCQVYVKTDFQTTHRLMEILVKQGFIRVSRLLIDSYGVVFDVHRNKANDCELFFNYMPFDDTLIRQVRITEDGYVGQCCDMLYARDPTRFKGNVREDGGLCKILEREFRIPPVD